MHDHTSHFLSQLPRPRTPYFNVSLQASLCWSGASAPAPESRNIEIGAGGDCDTGCQRYAQSFVRLPFSCHRAIICPSTVGEHLKTLPTKTRVIIFTTPCAHLRAERAHMTLPWPLLAEPGEGNESCRRVSYVARALGQRSGPTERSPLPRNASWP